MDDLDGFENQMDALVQTVGSTRDVVASFDQEMRHLRQSATLTSAEVGRLSRAVAGGLRSAFDGLVFDGMRLSDALRQVSQSIVDAVYNAATSPVQNAVGGAVTQGIEALVGVGVPFADGAPFTQGRVMPFASGGIVSGPTYFPMRGGTGLMGEAGPEAIMPLARGPDGRLGVRSQGGGQPVHITMNVSTPDVAGFRRSQSQIASDLSRALGRGQRNA